MSPSVPCMQTVHLQELFVLVQYVNTKCREDYGIQIDLCGWWGAPDKLLGDQMYH